LLFVEKKNCNHNLFIEIVQRDEYAGTHALPPVAKRMASYRAGNPVFSSLFFFDLVKFLILMSNYISTYIRK